MNKLKNVISILVIAFFAVTNANAQPGAGDHAGPSSDPNHLALVSNSPAVVSHILLPVFSSTQCGLNYTQGSVTIETRDNYQTVNPADTGSGLPARLTLNYTPGSCNNLIKAYMYWTESYRAGTDTNQTIIFTDPNGITDTVAAQWIGSDQPKCWAEIGTYSFRADVTNLINVGGVYTIDNILNVATPSWEVDGVTLLVIYKDPTATYEGTLVLYDGLITLDGGVAETNITGFTVCNSGATDGHGIVIASDLQDNVGGAEALINNVAEPIPSLFWNFVDDTLSYAVGQTSSVMGIITNTDCFAVAVSGVYYRSTCMGCTGAGGLLVQFDSTNAVCDSLNTGSASVTATGGVPPYTYSWSTGATTSHIADLSAGNYSVTVLDSAGCSYTHSFSIITTGSPVVTISPQGPLTICPGAETSLTASVGGGNCSDYTVSQIPFSPLTGNIGVLNSAAFIGGNDDGYFPVPLPPGFAFNFYCYNYNTLFIGANGLVSFVNPPNGFQSYPLPTIYAPFSICGSWTDLTMANSGYVDTFTVGTSPNRKFVVDYNDVPMYNWAPTDTGTATYQIILYETTNVIEIHTTNNSINADPAHYKVMGIEDAGSNYAVVPGRNFQPWTATNDAWRFAPSANTNTYTYEWSPAININNTDSSSVIVSPTSNTTYIVTATNSSGCTGTASVTINMGTITPIILATDSTTFCQGGNVTLYLTNYVSYLWNTGATTQSIYVTTGGTYFVTVTDTNGCIGTASQVVTVNVCVPMQSICHTLNPVHSTIVNNYLSDSLANFNNFPDFYANAWTQNSIPMIGRGLMEFDFSTIPNNANVYSASLSLYGYNSTTTPQLSSTLSGSNASTLRRITSSWNSSTVTWHTQPSTTTTNEVPLPESTSSTEDYLNMNILNMVNDMISNGNNGLMMMLDTEHYYRCLLFATMNNPDSSVFPRLDLCYSIPYTIVTNQTPTSLCAGGTIQVGFTSNNMFNNGNIFTAQLSDSSGSFANPVNIGTLNSITPGVISAIIPANTPQGSHYRIRVISTNVVIIGSDNGSDISIAPLASPIINANGPTTFCQGGSVTLSVGIYPTYLWSNGSTMQSIIVNTGGIFGVTVSNINGCAGSSSISVIVNQNAIDSITANGPTSFCHGDSVTLNAGSFSSYHWNTGSSSEFILVNTSGTYSVTVSNNAGCTGTASIVINASQPVNPTITANGPTAFCQGGSVTLDAGSWASYHWSNGSTAESIDVTATGTFRVTVTNANGCTGTATQSVNVYFNPAVTITASGSTTICQGNSVTLDAGLFADYLWNTGAAAETISASTAGTYTVTVTNNFGCTASASQAVSVTSNPSPDIIPNGPTSFCQGGSVMLDAGIFFTYQWSTNSTTETISATTSGTYTVTVSLVNGCTGTASIGVTVNAAPTPTITANGSTTFCSGGSVMLDAGAWTSYHWSTGASSETISASTSGNYMVTITDANGCTGMASQTVTAYANPTPFITGNTSICNGNSTTLSTDTYISYNWSTSATTEAISVSTSGSYSVTVTDNNGCTGMASQTVTVNNNPVPNITYNGPTTFCQGGSVTLTAGSYSTYLWSNGATTGSISASAGGTYMVTVTDNNGCTGTASIGVTVNLSPTETISTNSNTTFCAGDSVTLNAGTWVAYAWNTGSTTQSITVYGSQPYCVTVTDNHGCTGTACQFVDVFALPTPTITPSGPTTFCSGSSVTLHVGTYAAYLWSNGATTSTIAATTTGIYSVTIANINNCTASASISITVNPSPVPVISPSGPTTLCQGGSVTLNAGTYVSYHWMNSQTTQSILVLSSGNYVVTVTGNNGCTGSTSQAVTITPFSNPVITASGPVVFCAPGSVTLDAGIYNTYNWSNGATTETITTSASGLYVVTVSNGANCSATALKSVTANAGAMPTILVTNLNNLCGGGYAHLTVGSSFASYLWSDATTTQMDSVNAGGTYTVTVTNTNGCTGSASTTVASACAIPVIAATPTTNIGVNYAMANWIQPSCHVSYNVRVSVHNANVWTVHTIAPNTHYTISGLTANTTYDWQVQTNCNASLTSVSGYSASQTFTTLLREEGNDGPISAASFNVYPNPASDEATIVFSSDKEAAYTIRLMDILGKEVMTITNTSVVGENQYQMNLSTIAKGIYMVILQNENGTLQKKIVVN